MYLSQVSFAASSKASSTICFRWPVREEYSLRSSFAMTPGRTPSSAIALAMTSIGMIVAVIRHPNTCEGVFPPSRSDLRFPAELDLNAFAENVLIHQAAAHREHAHDDVE